MNLNGTEQSATQEQAGGCCAPSVERVKPSPCCSGGTGVQAVGQFADSSQTATSAATSTQDHPSNTNTPVRIGSYGDDGAVSQTNASIALSGAGNLNLTDQSATQQQAGGLGTGVQAIGQKAGNDQYADSSATSTQSGASNTNAPVRIGSPGGGGTVEQTNASIALSGAGNLNATKQSATQTQGGGGCCGYGTGVQAIGQKAWSSQTANSKANSAQYRPSNTNAPVRIASEGYDGAVTQTNGSLAASAAGNLNATAPVGHAAAGRRVLRAGAASRLAVLLRRHGGAGDRAVRVQRPDGELDGRLDADRAVQRQRSGADLQPRWRRFGVAVERLAGGVARVQPELVGPERCAAAGRCDLIR